MKRSEDDGYNPDDETELRQRIANQYTPAADQAPGPETVAAPDPGGYAPSADPPAPAPAYPEYQPERQQITDPSPQAASPPDPNSPAALAEQNRIYGVGGTAFNPPTPTATFDPNAGNWNPAQTAQPNTGAPTRPSGGQLSDPGFASQFVAWAATQPGVNPSVKNDPGYWVGRFTSGAFGNDQEYAIKRMMQAEGAPEAAASGAAPRATGNAAAPTAYTSQSFAPQSAGAAAVPQGIWTPEYIAQIRQLIMERLASAGQPVDENDPSIAAPLTAARDESTRATDKERNQLAEHLYASGGLNTDAITQGIQQSSERNAGALSGLRGTLVQRALQAKTDELQNLLQMALASGDAQSARDVQMQLALIAQQTSREGMSLDAGKYAAYLNQQSVLAGLNG